MRRFAALALLVAAPFALINTASAAYTAEDLAAKNVAARAEPSGSPPSTRCA